MPSDLFAKVKPKEEQIVDTCSVLESQRGAGDAGFDEGVEL